MCRCKLCRVAGESLGSKACLISTCDDVSTVVDNGYPGFPLHIWPPCHQDMFINPYVFKFPSQRNECAACLKPKLTEGITMSTGLR